MDNFHIIGTLTLILVKAVTLEALVVVGALEIHSDNPQI